MKTSDSSHRIETRVVVPGDFNKEICAKCPAAIEGDVEDREDNTVARKCELQQAIAKGWFPDILKIRERIMDSGAEELPECSATKSFEALEQKALIMKTSDSSHRIETRVVVPGDFNKEICAKCPAAIEGDVENRKDNTVARECELQQAIAESRLLDTSEIRRKIEIAFASIEELPVCSATESFEALAKSIRIRNTVLDTVRRMQHARRLMGA